MYVFKTPQDHSSSNTPVLCAVRFYGYYQSALTVPDFSDILFQAGLNVILSIGNKPQVECVH